MGFDLNTFYRKITKKMLGALITKYLSTSFFLLWTRVLELLFTLSHYVRFIDKPNRQKKMLFRSFNVIIPNWLILNAKLPSLYALLLKQ